jgi:hypothetical protein
MRVQKLIEAIRDGAPRCGSAPERAGALAVVRAESTIVTVRSFTTPSMAIPVT